MPYITYTCIECGRDHTQFVAVITHGQRCDECGAPMAVATVLADGIEGHNEDRVDRFSWEASVE